MAESYRKLIEVSEKRSTAQQGASAE